MRIKDEDISEVLINRDSIKKRIEQIANEINAKYESYDQELIVIGILNGSTIFHSDLVRELNIQINVDWICLSSYGSGTKSSGVVRVIKDLSIDVKDKRVLIVEDILDSGLTLSWLVKNLESRGVKSCEIVTLLRKKLLDENDSRVECRWVGFDIPNKFVVGFGLDYDNKYRNLPYVGVLDSKVYDGGLL